jgi:hypothetical protein
MNRQANRNSNQDSTQKNANIPAIQYRNSSKADDFWTGVAKIAIGVILAILVLLFL